MNSTLSSSTGRNNKFIKYILIAALWIAVWEVMSMIVANRILLVGPLDTLRALGIKLSEASFWMSLGGSSLRIVGGYAVGFAGGLLLAVASYRFRLVEDILLPPVTFLKSAPVASFVVIFLIWWNSSVLAAAICICVVMPQIYISVLEGLKETDNRLLEMAQVNGMRHIHRVLYIYRPSVRPYLEAGIKVSAGMSWKSGVAAEVIGTPASSIGGALYMSKIYLDTAGVFAYTIVIILLSFVFERALLYGIKQLCKIQPIFPEHVKNGETESTVRAVEIENLCKSYDGKVVYDDYNVTFSNEKLNILSSVSGSGKTTLLRIICGLEKADGGSIRALGTESLNGLRFGMLFQEDRLCEDYSALINVAMICGDTARARDVLLELLDEDDINRPVRELSGGQRRRVAIARAYSRNADVYLIDEPYNGLDEANRQKVSDYIRQRGEGVITVMASHMCLQVHAACAIIE